MRYTHTTGVQARRSHLTAVSNMNDLKSKAIMLQQCANCGNVILFGGIKHGSLRYCNAKCYEAIRLGTVHK